MATNHKSIPDDVKHLLRIPALALFEGDRCWIVGPDQTVRSSVLTLGLRNWSWVEVEHGLVAGDEVVVQFDADALDEGEAVQIEDATASVR